MRITLMLFSTLLLQACKQESKPSGESPRAEAQPSAAASIPSAQAAVSAPTQGGTPPEAMTSDLEMFAVSTKREDSLIIPILGNDVYKPGSYRYFALCARADSVWLDSVRVEIRLDSVASFYDNDGALGTVIRLALKPWQRVYFRSSRGLEGGPVKTWYLNEPWAAKRELPDSEKYLGSRTLRKTLELPKLGRMVFAAVAANRAEDTSSAGGYDVLNNVYWTLTMGSSPPIRFAAVGEPWVDPSWSSADEAILWIGDLDRDGKPDVLMSPVLGPAAGDRLYQIFLSHTLAPGQEWKPAAEFFYYPPGMGD